MRVGLSTALLTLSIVAVAPLWGRASGANLTGYSGAPGEGTCTSCHSANANTAGGAVAITADRSTYPPGQLVRIRVTVADPAARRWGFELSPRLASNAAAGILVAADSAAQVSGATGALQFATQTSSGTRAGTSGSSSYDLFWIAPPAGSGPVTLYAAGLACNNNGGSSGDATYTAKVTIPPAAAVVGTARALPQFVFGGGGLLRSTSGTRQRCLRR